MALDLSKFTKEAKALRKPPQIIVYGQNGLGKSSLCAPTEWGVGAENPIFMNVNNRISHLPVAGNDQHVENYEDVRQFLGFILNGEHAFKTLVVDAADDLERIIFEEVINEYNFSAKTKVSAINEGGLAFGIGDSHALRRWDSFLKTLSMIRDKRDMTIVILAQVDTRKSVNADGEDYPIVCPKLHGSTTKGDSALALFTAWADLMMYMRRDVYTKTDSSGFDKKNPKLKAIGGGEISLYTKDRVAYRAKDTFNLPEKIDASDNAFANIMAHIDNFWKAKAPIIVPKEVIDVANIDVAKTVNNTIILPLPEVSNQIFNLN